MQSTLKLRDSDPHDIFAIEPEAVPVAWADKVLADITRDDGSPSSESAASAQTPPAGVVAGLAAPAVDTTCRATAVGDLRAANDQPAEPAPTGKWVKSAIMLVFGLCSAAAAAAWQHHGDAAKQMISSWTPSFTLASSPAPEKSGLAGPPDASAVQAAAPEPAASQPAAAASPAEGAVAATAPSAESTQLQSMARDLAAMGQQIEQLKAGIAELRASQQAMARDAARSSEVKTTVPNPRPKAAAPPPRSAAAPAHRPVQAAAPAPLPPPPLAQAGPSYASPPPAPPPQTMDQFNEPVVRPPMPLR